MSILFNASTHDIDFGSAASLDNLAEITIMSWIYPTTIDTNSRRLIQKRGTGRWEIIISDVVAADTFSFNRSYATTEATATAAANTLTLNAWQCIAATSNASAAPKLYRGTLTSTIAETSYAAQTAPSGALTDDSAASVFLGRRPLAGGANYLGRIATVQIWSRVLTLGELSAQQFRPHKTSGCVLFAHIGYSNTTSQVDLSGEKNNGTINGAPTLENHVPIKF